jgi:hypothetical protein
MRISVQRKYTFRQRFTSEAIWWGIPMLCIELIGVPIFGWPIVLILAVPATLAGVLAVTAIEHLLISPLSKRNLP